MAKKITAPHSYDPGKGRPKEYLAYLNEREMAYLRSINGNNMERGPRGLPSFPPEDAVGSSSKAGSKGPGGPSGPNSGPSKSTGGGGNLGGGSKGGPGGPSGPNSGPSRSSSPSTGGGGKGPGGPSGPNSAPSRSPSSPMGGQGASFSSPKSAGSYNADRTAQQRAQVNDTRSAVRNTPAARNDLAVGGIRTLNVGPIGTPVNVGPRVAPTQNRTSVAGGWGVAGVGIASPNVPNFVSNTTASPSKKQISDRIPAGKQFGVLGSGYDERIPAAPLGPREYSPYGMDIPDVVGRQKLSPEQEARVGVEQQRQAQELRDFLNREADPFPTGNPNMAGNPTVAQSRKENPLAGTGYGTFNISGVDRMMAAPEDLPPEKTPTEARDRSFSNSFISSAAAATPGSVDLRGAGYGTFNVPKSAGIDAELGKIEKELDAPPVKEMKDMTVEEMIRALRPPGRKEDGPFPAASFRKKAAETYTSPYDKPDQTYTSVAGGMGMSPFNQTPYDDRLNPESTTTDFSGKFSSKFDNKTNAARRDARYGGSWSSESGSPEGDQPTDAGEPTDDVYGPKNVDPEVQDLMKDVDKKNKRGVKGIKSVPLIGNVFKALDAGRSLITGKNTTEADADLKRAYMQGSTAQKAELEAKYPNLTKFAQMAGLDPQLPMSNYESWRERSFGTSGGIGGSTSTTSPGGGISDIGSGGKNEPPRIRPVEKEAPKPPAKPKEGGPRPSIYYKWDLGVDVPSPTDSDYTLYTKYLQEKAAAKAGFA